MALIVIAAIQAAITVGTVIYRLMNQHDTPLPTRRDLEYMSATSGQPIPFGYCRCRVAGNVIWTSGIDYFLLSKDQAGPANLGPDKGAVYIASLAVSFGEGPGTINRIWADSKLIYNADPAKSNAVPVTDWPAWSNTQLYNPGNQVGYAGDVWQCLETNTNSPPTADNTKWLIISTYPPWNSSTEYFAGDLVTYGGQIWLAQASTNNGTIDPKVPGDGDFFDAGKEHPLFWILLTEFYPPPTMYPGDENQLPDPLIQASEGVEFTPAYRGQIYCVWENLHLINFGNRIPSLRAEVDYGKVHDAEPGDTVAPGSGPEIVSLAWAPSTDPAVTSYNVYRGTISGGPYTRIATGVLAVGSPPVTAYDDTTVLAPGNYYYVVTEVSSAGESAYSNELLAVVT